MRGTAGRSRPTRAALLRPRAARPLSGDRAARALFGDRAARACFGDRAARPLSGDRAARALFGDRAARALFGDRAARALFGDRAARALFGDRAARACFGDRSARALFGDRAARALFGDRAARTLCSDNAARASCGDSTARASLSRYAAWLAAAVCTPCLIAPPRAAAFPASDASNPSVVSPASAASPDASDASALAHQLQLLGPFGSAVGPGWTFTPSLTLQEAYNDNVFQSEDDRRWDLITYLTPGIAIYGDTPNVQLRLNYQPTLIYYARNPSLNQIAENLDAIGDVTLWQDHLYLDARATAGVGSANGSTPGLGFGSGGTGQPTNGITGLTKQNSTQYTAFAVSPYFLQQFDTYGTLKIGYTLGYSTSSNNAGSVPLPTNTTGPSASQISNQELLQFTSGTFLERMTDTVLISGNQFQGTGASSQSGHNDTASNQVNYALNRWAEVFGSIGYEDIDYSGTNSLAIHDITWQLGTTLTPSPRSTLTLSYGHQQGVDSFSANGLYQLTERTSVNVSYGQTLGTLLQQLQDQLAQTDINSSGVQVNSRTGAPIFNANSLLGTQNQLYRSTTATVGTTTQLDRDTITFNLQYADYTAAGTGATGSTTGVTGTANWLHSLRDDLTLSSSGSYGIRWFLDPGGTNKFFALTASLNYVLSETVTGSLSYEFYDLNSTQPGQTLYQDIIILSLTKRF